jgi:rfaE bifunctional protein nucleotidyltransferase chain/domain
LMTDGGGCGRRVGLMHVANPKVMSVAEVRAERDRLKAAGKTLVFTNGCFDILHRGHVAYLTFARNQGDALVVGLNSDASVKTNKGDKRPVNPAEDRALVLGALKAVDFVVVFDEKEPKDLIARVLPDVLVKGKDWAHYVSGREIVEANGGRVVLADLVEGRSTTNTIGRILEVYGK